MDSNHRYRLSRAAPIRQGVRKVWGPDWRAEYLMEVQALNHRLAPGVEDSGKPEGWWLPHGSDLFRLNHLSRHNLLWFQVFSGTRPTGRGGAPTRSAGR